MRQCGGSGTETEAWRGMGSKVLKPRKGTAHKQDAYKPKIHGTLAWTPIMYDTRVPGLRIRETKEKP